MENAKRLYSVEQIVRAQNSLTTKGGKRDRKESEKFIFNVYKILRK